MMIWMSKRLAARLWDLAEIEVELLCRVGALKGRKNSCQSPGGWSDEKKRSLMRRQLITVGGW